ncbi:hemolysin family protein [Myceligenerans pegani]|uniref:HlyC/CorC family transporter n=1 Tax=Myceligenerans pegani TaxID=2776917 RepID=A0ABR9MZ89_9MICO|nr:hemolysin family protein [Myceligenerans sp. TRM 65318]MBE1876173.1 HlyC/CorC family transporter [Myceligenerans sp. TRM 65318]MBE3018444.1 HlyC/CorC family transporter [Myceligenerans sp. TRM 65318]
MSTTTAIAVAVVLLAGNAFFVGAEFAVLSAKRSQIEPLAAAGNRRAQTVLWAMEHVSLMLACAQLGVTVCSTGLGIVAEPALAHLLETPLHALGVEELAHPIAMAIALAIVVYLHVVLGEMVPKNLAVSAPERAVLWFGPPLVLLARVVRPIITALNWLANHAVRLTGVEPRDEVASAFTAEEVQSIVEHSQAEGVLQDDLGLLSGALEFSEKTAGDVMVPVGSLVTLTEGVTPDDVERLVAEHGFSRFPVLSAAAPEDNGVPGTPVVDDERLIGYLHLKDVLYATGEARTEPVALWRVRALANVRPDDEVEDTLRVMQRSGAHLARVVGAGGELQGVVFLEDILEELVGEVRDAMQRR